MSFERFFQSYLVTALWSSTDESREDGGDPLDAKYTTEDIAEESLVEQEAQCRAFYDANQRLWNNDAAAGHDFWLTRNGHGAGFWDGDYEEPYATLLTDASKKCGEVDPYVGDDGKVWFS